MDNNNQNYGQQSMQGQQYTNMQQPMQNQQYGYTQQPMQNQQYGYTQQPMQNQQYGYTQQPVQGQQMQQYGYAQQPAPKKIVLSKKAKIIIAAVIVVILGIIFIPKLLRPDTPFDKVELGMSVTKVMDIYNLTEDDFGMFGDTLYADETCYGVEGSLQLCLDDAEVRLDHINWYVYRRECKTDKQFENAIKEVKKCFKFICGKPEHEKDGENDIYIWEAKGGEYYELEVRESEFVLRYGKE